MMLFHAPNFILFQCMHYFNFYQIFCSRGSASYKTLCKTYSIPAHIAIIMMYVYKKNDGYPIRYDFVSRVHPSVITALKNTEYVTILISITFLIPFDLSLMCAILSNPIVSYIASYLNTIFHHVVNGSFHICLSTFFNFFLDIIPIINFRFFSYDTFY